MTRLRLFLLVTGFSLLFAGGHLYSVDDETQFLTTQSLIERGALSIEPDPDRNLNIARGRDGRYYSYYSPATSFLGVPLYLIGKLLAGIIGFGGFYITRGCFSLQGQIWGGIGAVIVYSILRERGAKTSSAVAVSLVHAFATYAFMESRTVMTNFPVGCLNLWVWGRILCGRTGARDGALAGLALSLGLLYRYDSALLWPVWMLAGGAFARGMLIGLAPGVAIAGAYNFIRFGSALATGAPDVANLFGGDLFTGFMGLTVDASRGVLWYSPLSVAGLLGLLSMRAEKNSVRLALIAIELQLLFAAWLANWNGGACWGPRHLGAVLPILSIGILPLWEGSRAWIRRTGVACAVALQLFGAVVSTDSWNDLLWDYSIAYEASWSQFRYNPWYGQTELLKRVTWERVPAEYRALGKLPVGSAPPNQIVRKSLDFWPVYAWKMGMPSGVCFGLAAAVSCGLGAVAISLRRSRKD